MLILRLRFLSFVAVLFASLLMVGQAYAVPQLLVDMNTGEVLFQKDAGKKWHPASLTKLMTAYVTYEAIKSGRVSLDTLVTLSPLAKREPPSRSSFPVESALLLNDALYVLLVKSANDMAIAIAETVSGTHERFVVEMNLAARNLGMTASHFANANGLHDDTQYTSARDMAVLTMHLRGRFPQYNKIYATKTIFAGPDKLKQSSYNHLLTEFAGTTGMKTGYVCASGYNMIATASRNGRQLMTVVLGGSSGDERNQLSGYLMSLGYANRFSGSGRRIGELSNDTRSPPPNMRPFICGTEREAYKVERAEQFKGGQEGQPDYLGDTVVPRTYPVRMVGRFLNVSLPRARPAYVYSAPKKSTPVTASFAIPLPRLRPSLL